MFELDSGLTKDLILEVKVHVWAENGLTSAAVADPCVCQASKMTVRLWLFNVLSMKE